MAIKKYLDDKGLETLVKEIKKSTTKVYKVKGSAVYAWEDDSSVLHPASGEDEYHSDIDSVGLWQLIDGTWTKITTFEVGWVYNALNTFTTDADFVEGAGSIVEAGSNIVVAEADGDPVTYKWDQLGNVLDLTDYQTKKLVSPLTVFSNETPTVYTAAADLPTTEAAATATITDQMVAIIGGDSSETGDVYRATVTENAADATQNDITWVKLGNQLTVEGSLEFLGNTCPNTPITDQEIIDLFNA